MVTYLRNPANGKFVGSVGVGKAKVPTAGRPIVTTVSVQKGSPEVTEVVRLARSESSFDRRSAANSLLCPPEVIHNLVWDKKVEYAWARIEAMKNPNLPERDMELVVDLFFRPAIENPNIPAAILDRLSRQWWDPNELGTHPGRMPLILRHPNVPREWLEEALDSINQNYMIAAASNSNLSNNLVTKIVDFPNRSNVQSALAQNHSISEEVRLRLINSQNVRVLAVLASALNGDGRQKVVNRIMELDQRKLAKMTVAKLSTDTGQLRELIYGVDKKVRQVAASNLATAEEDQVASALLD